MAKKAAAAEEALHITTHILVPKHEICSAKEKEQILKKHGVTEQQLPRIQKGDAALKDLGVKAGDMIRITRQSQTAGETVFYRVVTGD